ncbi:MAG: CO dehydrogenase/acetyl-CoA synthase delta subunit [Clostridia bacterium 62_21]|nr:MAG: CO dehydrogenase/acetyl-CoA synthase delta subunit [Clostridia bacterium 62_21]
MREKWRGRLFEVCLGVEPHTVRAGGDTGLPFHHFESETPNRPVVAFEVTDFFDDSWPQLLQEVYAGVSGDVAAWAARCVSLGADVVALRLAGAHPDAGGRAPEEAAAIAVRVAEAVTVPLIILGCGDASTDAAVLPEVAAALAGRNCLLGPATDENYKSIAAACVAHGHNIIARTPLDVNLAKQLNILITEMNLPPERIVMDPSIGPLGYGIEYAYSVIERMRTAALAGDRMLAQPVLCMVGEECWRTKEARLKTAWGEHARRAVLWEAVTASVLAVAGGSVFVFRHPDAARHFCRQVHELMKR